MAVAALLFAVALVSCAVFSGPQHWPERNGPVIPHDTFPGDCSVCHTSGGWSEIRAEFQFDHEASTGVALNGAHQRARCLYCHNDRGDVAEFAAKGCRGCHEDPHRGQLGNSCEDCHNEQTWFPRAMIVEHQATRFPLIGAHAGVSCVRCHDGAESGSYTRADTACESCHRSEVARSTVLDHLATGLNSDCENCHTPTSWRNVRFPHPTSFPLTGAHAGAQCADCHGSGASFAGLDSDCIACHASDYASTNDPPHALAGFSTDCEDCHTTVTWENARFTHVAEFSLDGSHVALDCQGCHSPTTFVTQGTDCVDCHLADYTTTATPNHLAAGFPTSCDDCHSSSTWTGATFDHTFPITSGDHSGLTCNDCHTNPGNPTQFTCISCHDHSAAEMLDEHDEVDDYIYASPACLDCHPDGQDR